MRWVAEFAAYSGDSLHFSYIQSCYTPFFNMQLSTYIQGADSGSTLRENIDAYQKYRIRPRILRDVSRLDTSASIFGHKNAFPMGVAPTAMQRLAHTDGESATVRACAKRSIVMGLSSFSTTTLEDVAEAADGHVPLVLQLYLFEEREHSKKLLARAKKAGYKAVFLTVDTPYLGRRNLEIRNQFKLPAHFSIPNFAQQDDPEHGDAEFPQEKGKKKERKPSSVGYTDKDGSRVVPGGPITFHSHAANPTLSWERDIEWLKKECGDDLQVWVKGVATGEDAKLAIKHGVDGIVVSNHGGRQLSEFASSPWNCTVDTDCFVDLDRRCTGNSRCPSRGSSCREQAYTSPRRRRHPPWNRHLQSFGTWRRLLLDRKTSPMGIGIQRPSGSRAMPSFA